MIHRLVATTAICMWAGTALAAPIWVGGVLITAVSNSTTCEAKLNDLLTAVFHPKLAGDTTVTTAVLQAFDSQKSYRFTPTTANFAASGNYNAVSWTGRALIKPFAGTYSNFVISPATITATTPFVNIRGKIQNYAGVACEVTFSASLSLKV
jgi:hypothetical protein